MDGQQQFEKPGQIAHRAQVSKGFVYELIRQGRLPAYRVGRRLLVPVGAWDRLLAGPSTEERQPL